jgi:CheY-like chemotaxis protein
MANQINNSNTVMLIDDNFIDLKINEKIIKITNSFEKIIVCMSGAEALTYLKNNIGNEVELPSFILLDIQMPEMNGFEFLEQYKKLSRLFTDKCKIAMLSSTLDFSDIQRAEANPFVVKLLKKPLIPATLLDVLNENR